MAGDLSAVELLKLAVPLTGAAGAAAWAGVKVALNGTRTRIAEVSAKVDRRCDTIEDKLDELGEHVTRNRVAIAALQARAQNA